MAADGARLVYARSAVQAKRMIFVIPRLTRNPAAQNAVAFGSLEPPGPRVKRGATGRRPVSPFRTPGRAAFGGARVPSAHVRSFRQTHDIRHSALDAESRGSERRSVWEFRAAGPRVKRGATGRRPVSPFRTPGRAAFGGARVPSAHVRSFRQTHDIRHSALDAESRGLIRRSVWEFRATGPRVKRGRQGGGPFSPFRTPGRASFGEARRRASRLRTFGRSGKRMIFVIPRLTRNPAA